MNPYLALAASILLPPAVTVAIVLFLHRRAERRAEEQRLDRFRQPCRLDEGRRRVRRQVEETAERALERQEKVSTSFCGDPPEGGAR